MNSSEIGGLVILGMIILIIYMQTKRFLKNMIRNREGLETIPKKVFQTWKTSDLPPKMAENRNRMMEQNPDFEYILMDDQECRNFIQEHFDKRTLYAYDKIVPGTYKADLWRYCVLYIYGGIYLDIKLRTVDDFRLKTLIDKEHLVKDRQEFFKRGDIGIYNACMVQSKGSECMKKCIEKVIENVETNNYGFNPLYPTGPGLLGDVYVNTYNNDILDMTYIGDENILYKGKIVIQSYPEYREEAPSAGKYGILWISKNIYK